MVASSVGITVGSEVLGGLDCGRKVGVAVLGLGIEVGIEDAVGNGISEGFIGVTLDASVATICGVFNTGFQSFTMTCTNAPSSNSMLSYLVSNGSN